jgi:hypothetical protein
MAKFVAREISVNVAPSPFAAIAFIIDTARLSDWTLPAASTLVLAKRCPPASVLTNQLPPHYVVAIPKHHETPMLQAIRS